jgi:hypothetical protein
LQPDLVAGLRARGARAPPSSARGGSGSADGADVPRPGAARGAEGEASIARPDAGHRAHAARRAAP